MVNTQKLMAFFFLILAMYTIKKKGKIMSYAQTYAKE